MSSVFKRLRETWEAETHAVAKVLTICHSCGQMTAHGSCEWCGATLTGSAGAQEECDGKAPAETPVRADGPLAAWQREIAEARTKYTACPECSQWTPVGRCTWCGTDTEDPATRKHHGDQRKFARVRSQVRLAPLYSAVRGLTKWDLREHGVLLGGLAKWIALGSLVGAVAGSASAFFLWSLDLVTRTRQSHVNLIWFLPLAGLLVGFLYSRFGENVSGGNNLILDELHQGGGRVPLRMAPFVLGGTLVTHLFGGSAGREGTAVQMGGSLADWLGRLFRLGPDDRRILLTSGVAGGFGSVFGTPLAGTVFGMEVTQVGGLKYESLVAAFAASMVGDLVTRAWGISHTLYPTIARLEPTFALLGKVAVLGVAAGLVSRLFAELGHTIRAAFKTMVPWELLRPVIGGAIVVVAVFGFHAFDYIGLGTPMILRSFTPGAVPYLAFLWKLLLTTITLGAGFQGGEVTPLFFIGATLGHALGQLLGLPVELAAAAGFVAVFAGAANTPLACIVMGAELFGSGGLPYLGLASILAYVSSGHAGIYTAQRVLYPKSNALPVPAHTTLRALHHGRTPILPALAAEGEEQTVTD